MREGGDGSATRGQSCLSWSLPSKAISGVFDATARRAPLLQLSLLGRRHGVENQIHMVEATDSRSRCCGGLPTKSVSGRRSLTAAQEDTAPPSWPRIANTGFPHMAHGLGTIRRPNPAVRTDLAASVGASRLFPPHRSEWSCQCGHLSGTLLPTMSEARSFQSLLLLALPRHPAEATVPCA